MIRNALSTGDTSSSENSCTVVPRGSAGISDRFQGACACLLSTDTLLVSQQAIDQNARIETGSLTTLTSLGTARNRAGLDALDSVFWTSDGLAMRPDASVASRLLAQPIAMKEMAGELGGAKLLGVFDQKLLKDDLDDDEADWDEAVDQAFAELEETTEA